jgi:hypothetical protein
MLLGRSTYCRHTGSKLLQDIQAACGKDDLMWPHTAHTTEGAHKYYDHKKHGELVGATHTESGASQSQSRNHPLLSNGLVNTFRWRYNSWIKNKLLGKTYNNT